MAIFEKSRLKFVYATELHMGANIVHAITLARIDIFDLVKRGGKFLFSSFKKHY